MLGHYLFCLGFLAGLSLLTVTAYRHISPLWFRTLLAGATGSLITGRYALLALVMMTDMPPPLAALRCVWFGASAVFLFSSTVAVDQLIRHPAMSSKKLLVWLSPFLLVYGAALLVAPGTPVRMEAPLGWWLRLSPAWQALLSVTQGVFVIAFVGTVLLLIRKIPVWRIRLALLNLGMTQLCLGLGVFMILQTPTFLGYLLLAEMLALFVLWYAYETGAALQGG